MMQLVPATGTPVVLPESFGVMDDGLWNPRVQAISYGLADANGNSSMIVRENIRATGKPVTLQGSLSRADLATLQALANSGVGISFQSSGRTNLACRFYYQGGPAVSGTLLLEAIEPPQDDDIFIVLIKLIAT